MKRRPKHIHRAKKNPPLDSRLKDLSRKFTVGAEMKVYDPRTDAIRFVASGSGMWGVARETYAKSRSAADVVQRSWEWHQQPDELIRHRQKYEASLSHGRKAGPYRVTAEPTRDGIRYFVWPLRPNQRVPQGYKTLREAERRLAQTYYDEPPTSELPPRKYSKAELSEWLPPAEIFAGRSRVPSRVAAEERRRLERTGHRKPPSRRRKESGFGAGAHLKPLVQQWNRFDPDWADNPAFVQMFCQGKSPPR